MEFHAVLHAPGGLMRVHFTDGGVNAAGHHPARYTTESFVEQHQIELSREFISGAVILLEEHDMPGEIVVITGDYKNSKAIETESEGQVDSKKADNETDLEKESPQIPTENEQSTEESSEENQAESEVMTFGCNDDAKDWLEETYGYVRSKLKTRADIVAAGKEQGVEIVFT